MVERFFARITTEAIRRGSFFFPCDNFKPLLTPTLPSITKTQKLLLGPPPQILSSENLKTPFLKLLHWGDTIAR